MQAEWDENYLTIEKQVAGSDLVIVGQVVKIDASRWNSADGKEWRPPEEQTLPIVYTTFYVEPTKVLKGEPKWGTPVALRATGVFSTAADQLQATGSEQLAMRVGENVVAFGRIEARYGPGGIYQPADAYWLESEENSLWAEQDGVFLNQGHTKDPAERSLMLSSLEAKITGYVANEQ